MKIRLFVKTYCGWCDQAKDWLDERGIAYETINVSANQKAFDEMIRLSGQTLAPVIAVDGKILADFGPAELAVFWGKISPTKKSS
jgi:glutaredoxin